MKRGERGQKEQPGGAGTPKFSTINPQGGPAQVGSHAPEQGAVSPALSPAGVCAASQAPQPRSSRDKLGPRSQPPTTQKLRGRQNGAAEKAGGSLGNDSPIEMFISYWC